MRIIAGSLKRRSIRVPKSPDVRPTTDRTREAMFSVIESRLDLDDVDVLDLFAGSGALGFEALSRGARSVVFVEQQKAALHTLRDNARHLDMEDACSIVAADVAAWLARFGGPPFHLILADPPYDYPGMAKLPEAAMRHLHPEGLLLLEHDRRVSFDDSPALIRTRAYGRTSVSVFGGVDTAE